jgi:hypothetical protein
MKNEVPNDPNFRRGNLMKTFLRTLVALGAVVLAFVAGPAAMATDECQAEATPFLYGAGGSLTGLPEAWVSGIASQVGFPGVNSGTAPFICTADPTPGIGFCHEQSNPADTVTISGDWSAPDVTGCPVLLTDPTGSSPIVIVVTSADNEGTAEHKGKYSILSVAWWSEALAYLVDAAHPNFDLDNGFAPPLGAAEIPSPVVADVDEGATTAEVLFSWSPAVAYDDCALNPVGTCTDFPGGTRPGLITDYVLYQNKFPTRCDDPPKTSLLIDPTVWEARSRCDFFPPDPKADDCTATSGRVVVPFDPDGVFCTYLALGIEVNELAPKAVSAHRSVGITDTDLDGIPDTTDNCPTVYNPPPVPGDPQTDSDGDNIGDACDNCPDDANSDQTDSDGDCPAILVPGSNCGDVCDNCPDVSNEFQEDGDFDGIGDACDSCPTVAGPDVDTDFDGYADECDNCPDDFNTSQLDSEGDGVGELCDNCPGAANSDQANADGDAWGNVCDNCPNAFQIDQNNTDNPENNPLGDLYGDVCDNCPTIPNQNQNADACDERVEQAVIEVILKGGIVTWRTTTEITVAGFNLVWIRNGKRFQANPSFIPCTKCDLGVGDLYAYPLPKHKTSRNLWVEMITEEGASLWGPAVYVHVPPGQ